jgi:hypothetical protein
MNRFFHSATILPLILVAIVTLATVRAVQADDALLDPEEIKAALHTNSEIENGFIEKTVAMVKSGTLPRDMFMSTFIWARKKARFQFQYFKHALKIRAAAAGISL